VDWVDRFFYALIPVFGYGLILLSGIMLLMQWRASAEVTAAALVMLLLAGIRNAWDMMTWMMLRLPTTAPPPSQGSQQ
jgi:hypothetical protein